MKHQNCSEMLEKLPLKSTKFNLDVSNFWEFENESWEWEWEFSQQNWESRLRMRWELSLRVSISRSRWESRRSLYPLVLWYQLQDNFFSSKKAFHRKMKTKVSFTLSPMTYTMLCKGNFNWKRPSFLKAKLAYALWSWQCLILLKCFDCVHSHKSFFIDSQALNERLQ